MTIQTAEERGGSAEVERLPPRARVHVSRHHLSEYIIDQRGHRCLLRDIDELAAAGNLSAVHRGGERQRGAQSGLVIDEETAGALQGRSVRVGIARAVITPAAAVEDVQAACVLHLGGRVVTERSDGADDQAGMAFGEG